MEQIRTWNISTSAALDEAKKDWLVYVWNVEEFTGTWKDAVKYAKAFYCNVHTDKRRGTIWVRVEKDGYYDKMREIRDCIDYSGLYPAY